MAARFRKAGVTAIGACAGAAVAAWALQQKESPFKVSYIIFESLLYTYIYIFPFIQTISDNRIKTERKGKKKFETTC